VLLLTILSSEFDSELVSKIHTSMKCFVESSDFKKTILQMIATRYPSDEVLHLTHIFTKLDKSGEGLIYFSDFKEFLSDFHYSDSDLKAMFGCIVSINEATTIGNVRPIRRNDPNRWVVPYQFQNRNLLRLGAF
jgi:hypothetical protein